MTNEKIYKIDFGKLVIWLTPVILRKERMIAWLHALITPIIYLYDKFLGFREDTNYWLHINGQVCYLEKMLNDKYDRDSRRIYIDKGKNYEPVFIYQEPEADAPLFTFLEAEENETPPYLYVDNETTSSNCDFIIMVPVELRPDDVNKLNKKELELNTLVSMYALPDKVHSIQYF